MLSDLGSRQDTLKKLPGRFNCVSLVNDCRWSVPLVLIAVYTYLDICMGSTCMHIRLRICKDLHMYWVGQKVHLGFSVRCYGRARMKFLANLL